MLADAQAELIRREELEPLQLERLKQIVAWAYDKSAFYRQSFQRHGVTPNDIQSLDDVSKLPFLTRAELIGNELDILTLPLSSVVRVSRCGKVTSFYTKGDIRNNVEMTIRALAAADVLRGSTVGIAGDLSDSRILDVLYALESIGATVVLSGSAFQVDKVIGVTDKLGDYVITSEQIKLFAPSALGNAGMIYRCEAAGLHVQEDKFFAEVLDGELVLTTLTAQALPLIRFKTGQRVRLINEPCPCGRSFIRIT